MTADAAVREEQMLDLFIHPGWRLLIQDMTDAHQVLVETAHTVKNMQELYRRKGEIQQLSALLSFEELYKLQAREADARSTE